MSVGLDDRGPRRLSLSGDAQWTPPGSLQRRRSSGASGYALSPKSPAFAMAPLNAGASAQPASGSTTPAKQQQHQRTTSASAAVVPAMAQSPQSQSQSRKLPHTKNLNAASIFQRLGLADPPVQQQLQPTMTQDDRTSANTTPTPDSHEAPAGPSLLSRMAAANISGSSDARSNSNSESGTATIAGGSGAAGLSASNPNGGSVTGGGALRSMQPIEADIILPFADRPSEIQELLEAEPKNRGLYEQLRDTFSSPSSPGKKWTFDDLCSHLRQPRSDVPDQEFIDTLKAGVQPRSQLLWERLRACLGVDVDDERGTDRFEELSSDICYSEDPDAHAHAHAQGAPIEPSSLQDYLLSPRAVLQQQQQQQDSSPRSAVGGLQLPNVGALAPPPVPVGGSVSPSGFSYGGSATSGMSISPLSSGHAFPPPSPSTGSSGAGGGLPTATQEHPNPFSPRSALSALAGAGANSSPTSSGTSSPARNHRRTSSGSSGFRRSLAMSSIDEDGPVHDFSAGGTDGGDSDTYDSSPAMTPSDSLQGLSTAAAPGQKVGLGDLLRLRGAPLESPTAAQPQPFPNQRGGAHASGSVGHALGLGGLGGTSHPAVQGSALASSLGSTISSTFAPGSGPALPSGVAASSLGLSMNAQGQPFSASYNISPSKARHSYSRGSSYEGDGYAAVFESEDGDSSSVRYRGGAAAGPGPGMRHSFSAQDQPAPAPSSRPKVSGFALAGRKPSTGAGANANAGNKAFSGVRRQDSGTSTGEGEGTSTPRAGSPRGQ